MNTNQKRLFSISVERNKLLEKIALAKEESTSYKHLNKQIKILDRETRKIEAEYRKEHFVKKFVAYFHFVKWSCLSLGFHVDISLPNIEIHLPFGFIRIGWHEYHKRGPNVQIHTGRKRTYGMNQRGIVNAGRTRTRHSAAGDN